MPVCLQLIERTARAVKDKFGFEVIYGDSVLGDTPLLLDMDGTLCYKRIDELYRTASAQAQALPWHGTKQAVDTRLCNIRVWTDKGWTSVRSIVRHRTRKTVFRVLTHTGLVDVTEDHSLVSAEGKDVQPTSVAVGDDLLTVRLPDVADDVDTAAAFSIDHVRHFGCFMGDADTDDDFVPSVPDSFFNRHGHKVVPVFVLGASIDKVQAFMDGYCAAYYGDKNKQQTVHRFDTKGKEGAAGLCFLGHRLGYSFSLNTRADNVDIFCVTLTKGKSREVASRIKKLHVLHKAYDGYVYDLTTENHHFGVGPGGLVVHNTDSVFVKMKTAEADAKAADNASMMTQAEAWEKAEEVANFVNDVEFKNEPNIIIENEKLYYPFLSFDKKKKYIGRKFEGPASAPKLEYKGVELSRRDIPKVTKTIVMQVLQQIIPLDVEDTSIETVRRRVRPVLLAGLRRLLDDGYALDDYLICKSYRDNTKSDTVAHVRMVQRLNRRIEKGLQLATPVLSGQRVEYLVAQGKGKVCDRAVDKGWFLQKQMRIDRHYYMTQQIIKPLQRLVEYFFQLSSVEKAFADRLLLQQMGMAPLFGAKLSYRLDPPPAATATASSSSSTTSSSSSSSATMRTAAITTYFSKRKAPEPEPDDAEPAKESLPVQETVDVSSKTQKKRKSAQKKSRKKRQKTAQRKSKTSMQCYDIDSMLQQL